VLDALAPPLAIAPFEIVLGECGVFPPHGPPRVLWIGVKEGLASLQALHQEFNRRLLPFGYETDTRPFNAHLTLARLKNAPRGTAAIVREALRAVHVPPAAWQVTHAVVFQSVLSSRGSTYRALSSVNLGR
jgi:2'-5' RNA ligase